MQPTSPFAALGPATTVQETPQLVVQHTLADLLSVCWRRRITLAAVGSGIALLVFLSSLQVTPLYEARANVEVFLGEQPVNFQGGPSTAKNIDYSLLNTQRERLLSTPVLTQTFETSDLGEGAAYRNSANPVEVLRSRLDVHTDRNSWVIEVTLRDEDKRRACRGLDAMLASFFSYLDSRASHRSSSALEFLTKQVDAARLRRDQAVLETQSFRRQRGLISDSPNDNEFNRRLLELTKFRAELDQKLAASNALLSQIQAASEAPEPEKRLAGLLRIEAISQHSLVMRQQELLNEAEAEMAKLAPKYQSKHPRMREAQLDVDSKRGQLEDAVRLAQTSITTADEELRQQSTDLNRQIEREREALASYHADLITLESLRKEEETRESLLGELRRRQGEQEVVAHLDPKQVAINNPPEALPGPVNINRARSCATAVFLGLVSGVLAALGKESLDGRIRGKYQARKLTGLPLLAQIPKVRTIRHQVQEAAVPLLTESYRTLRATLSPSVPRGTVGRCMLITSPSSGEGKSTVAFHLATCLAAAGARVLLVDADMRNPTQHRHVGMTMEHGLSDLLAGQTQVGPTHTAYANLDFLGPGPRPASPTELLYSPTLPLFLEHARGIYDHIIFDTPPLTMVTDGIILSEYADHLILVLRDRYSTSANIVEALRRLEPVRNKVVGFVLNASPEGTQLDSYYYSQPEEERPAPAAQ